MDDPKTDGQAAPPIHLNPAAGQFLKSLVTAWTAFLLDWLVLELLIAVSGISASMLKPASYIAALVFTYIVSRYWIFKTRRRHSTAPESVLYVLGAVVSLGIAAMSIHILSERYSLLDYRISNALGMALVFVWNFLYRRYVVFPVPPPAGGPGSTGDMETS